MCFFPYKNKQMNKAAQAGIHEYKCGCCPECLSDKARLWALKCSAHAETTPACMVTLTYDTYIRDTVTGRVIGERVSDFSVCKKDAQDFIKRLREYFSRVKNVDNIKYVLTAEYGKRTHRAHYHAILFNVTFDDLIKYKKSKRGNWIYKSATLDKLWKHGICTVDCTNISAQVARYCTKYCAKDSRADDTFMLFSRGIGDENLLKKFNGISYIIDGREYPIPRSVWQKYICEKYKLYSVDKQNIKHYFFKYVCNTQRTDSLQKKIEKSFSCCESNSKRILTLSKKHSSLLSSFEEYVKPRRKDIKDCSERRQLLYDHYIEIISANEVKRSVCIADSIRLKRLRDSIRSQLSDPHYYTSSCRTQSYDRFNIMTLLACGGNIPIVGRRVPLRDGSVFIRSTERARCKREIYRYCRDNDSIYKRYLQYWKAKTAFIEKTRPTVRERILQLSNEKYYAYKQAALKCLNRIEYVGDPNVVRIPRKKYLPYPSRHNTANDRRYKSVPLKLYREVSGDHILDSLGVPYGQISIEIHENYKEIFELCLT